MIDLEHPIIKKHKHNIRICGNHFGMLLGHGTGVCCEILKRCANVEIDLYPVFQDDYAIDSDKIISALESIACYGIYDIINMSLGIADPEKEKSLKLLCEKIYKKGTVIISAFNNSGEMTYPACFSSVIGVDFERSSNNLMPEEYIYINGGIVNIICSNRQLRVNWDNSRSILTRGSSFYTARITGEIALCLYNKNENCDNWKLANNYLERHSKKNIYEEKKSYTFPEKVKKAIMFPYNKEIATCVGLSEYLQCKIVGIYDFAFSKHIGTEYSAYQDLCISNISSIEWDTFDAVIIGHLDKYSNAILLENINRLVNDAINQGKYIYCFDSYISDLCNNDYDNIWYPYLDRTFIKKAQVGKLWHVDKPVVAILGTKSQQGKFTTQVKLYHLMKQAGYIPGWVSTEPSGHLFGADYVFSYGYNSCIDLNSEQYSIAINDMIHMTAEKEIDIIITGLQSGVLPFNFDNMAQLTSLQFSLLFGINPDIFVLCVSLDDTVNFIERTINVVESYTDAVCLGILIFPTVITLSENGNLVYTNYDDSVTMQDFINELSCKVSYPVWRMNMNGIQNMANNLIERLSE